MPPRRTSRGLYRRTSLRKPGPSPKEPRNHPDCQTRKTPPHIHRKDRKDLLQEEGTGRVRPGRAEKATSDDGRPNPNPF